MHAATGWTLTESRDDAVRDGATDTQRGRARARSIRSGSSHTIYHRGHISLSEPLPGPLTEGQVEELRKALMRVQPFEVHFGPLRDFPPYPGVAFAITPEEPFMELREAVHATTIFRDSQLARRDIAPHMTIAEFITLEETARMLETLRNNVREGDWLVTSIEYAIPDEKVHFHRVLTLPLGAR